MEKKQSHDTHKFILENPLQGKTIKLVRFTTHLLTTLLTNVYNIDLQDHNNLSVNSLILTFNSNKFSYKCLLSLSHYIIFIDAKTCYLVIPELVTTHQYIDGDP